MFILLGLFIVGMILSLISCETSQEGEAAQQTLEPIEIKEWSGSGTKTTESFTISGNQWAVSCAFNPNAPTLGLYANSFSIEVYKSGISFPVELIANIANTTSGRSDISYIHTSGNFYLTISAFEGSWTIKVFDYR